MFSRLHRRCFVFCVTALITCGVTVDASGQDQPLAKHVEFFEQHIRPLLAQRCYECHSDREQVREGDLVLDSRQGWEAGGARGPAIVPGNVDESVLITAVQYQDSKLQMPPEEPLSAAEVAKLEQWVRMGAVAPKGPAAQRTTLTGPSDPVVGKEHWAFQPLAYDRPTLVDAEWSYSAIDEFVLSRLEELTLHSNAVADRITLARRLSFDLIGLPPSSTELQQFVTDADPNSLEQFVDRLLSSSHFGERWGRHWLDLARYADSNGLDENFLFREAWRFRNWVIDAINEDLPFDRFLLEQIAGDLLPYDTIDQRDRQRIGAGFLVIGPKVLLGNIPANQRMEIADEQIDTIGKAILGQTLGCARCHDHKFDPIPTEDYYALAGIFTSTNVVQRRHMLGQQRVMERLVGLGPKGDELNSAYERYWRERPSLTKRLQQANQALKLLTGENEEEFTALAREQPKAIAEEAKDSGAPRAQRIAKQKALVTELDAILKKPLAIPPRAMIPIEAESPAHEYVRLAGQFDRKGKQVERGFLQVLGDNAPSIPAKQSGRLQLASWLSDANGGAGQLAARVLANRIWQHLIGAGLVRTVDNFGRTGETPTHPELLDFLAKELIDSDWSIKHLIRQIVLSRTYRLSSDHQSEAYAVDPDNRWLWRGGRRRLEPEALRDAMLTVAGQLDRNPVDSTVSYLGDQATAVGANKNRRRTDFPCRSVYLPVIRNDLPELFDAFDFADPHATTGRRPQTLVPMQGLFMLNNSLVMDAAEATAKRLLQQPGSNEDLVDQLYVWAFGVPATVEERTELLRLIGVVNDIGTGSTEDTVRAWTLACQAVFASSRFQILE